MGVFDYILAKCPNCNAKIEGQTKRGEPSMGYYHIEDMMPAEAALILRNERLHCVECFKTWIISVDVPEEVKVTLKEEE